jgi:hypothetical protein
MEPQRVPKNERGRESDHAAYIDVENDFLDRLPYSSDGLRCCSTGTRHLSGTAKR